MEKRLKLILYNDILKKILIITRDFPPYEGRGNVMRILKFSKYLPEFGWQTFIVCEKKDDGKHRKKSKRKRLKGAANG